MKTPNVIFARHLLASRRQQSGETLSEFLRELHKFSKDCNIRAVSAEEYREELIRDTFINGIASSFIRQCLLENEELDLQTAFDQANALDLAQKNSEAYMTPVTQATAAMATSQGDEHNIAISTEIPTESSLAAIRKDERKCYFCGVVHSRSECPAREEHCHKCGSKGHFSKVCRSKKTYKSNKLTTAALFSSSSSSVLAACPKSLSQASVNISVKRQNLSALIDSGSSDSFISEQIVRKLKLHVHPSSQDISMALSTAKARVLGHCFADINLHGHVYAATCLGILKNLCSDVILGQDFQRKYKRVVIEFGGSKPDLLIPGTMPVCALSEASLGEPSFFANLLPGCKPIVTKSRHFSKNDRSFIHQEITQLLAENIIEPRTSPWWAQIVVVKDPFLRHKKRLCMDYSQTINQYTELDGYPLPRIDDMVNTLAKYKLFSTFDLKSAYHQVPIKESDMIYTGFEANGRLYHFCHVPFGVTNVFAVFQRAMDKMIEEEGLNDTFPYLDNITVAGKDQEEHDSNVQRFLEAVRLGNLSLNQSKTVESAKSINILGLCR